MPGVIESVAVAVSVFVGTAGLGAGAAAIAFTATTALIYTGISLGLSALGSALLRANTKPEQMREVIRAPISPRFGHYGLVEVAGVLIFLVNHNNVLYGALAVSAHRIDGAVSYKINGGYVAPGNFVSVTGAGGLVSTFPGDAVGQLWRAFGATPWMWPPRRRGDGIAVTIFHLVAGSREEHPRLWPNGTRTAPITRMRTKRVYDPRSGITAYSDNAALCIRDYMVSDIGMRLPARFLETPMATAAWVKAANICDQPVARGNGSSERRYRVAGSYSLMDPPVGTLRAMMAACGARLIDLPDGGVSIEVDAYEVPTFTVSEPMISSIERITSGPAPEARSNVIRASYMDQANSFASTDALPYRFEADVAQRGEYAEDLDLTWCPSPAQARRLMKKVAYARNATREMSLTLTAAGLGVMGRRFVRVVHPAFAIDGVFELVDQPILVTEGSFVVGVRVELRSYEPESDAWTAAEEGANPVSVPIDTTTGIAAPSNVVATRVATGAANSDVRVAWDAPAYSGSATDVEVRRDGESAFSRIATRVEGSEHGPIALTVDEYEIRVRFVTETGLESAWTTITLPEA